MHMTHWFLDLNLLTSALHIPLSSILYDQIMEHMNNPGNEQECVFLKAIPNLCWY